MDHSKLFYVLNGLVNGERGVYALTAGVGLQLADGHYHFVTDPVDGTGPFDSVQSAWEAGERLENTQTWAFPLDGSEPFLVTDTMVVDECNIAVIEFDPAETVYTCTSEGSYETLELKISVGDFTAAADVFRHLLIASAKYQ